MHNPPGTGSIGDISSFNAPTPCVQQTCLPLDGNWKNQPNTHLQNWKPAANQDPTVFPRFLLLPLASSTAITGWDTCDMVRWMKARFVERMSFACDWNSVGKWWSKGLASETLSASSRTWQIIFVTLTSDCTESCHQICRPHVSNKTDVMARVSDMNQFWQKKINDMLHFPWCWHLVGSEI